MKLDRLDHVVLTVRDIAATCEFYTRVLGMRAETFDSSTMCVRSVESPSLISIIACTRSRSAAPSLWRGSG